MKEKYDHLKGEEAWFKRRGSGDVVQDTDKKFGEGCGINIIYLLILERKRKYVVERRMRKQEKI